MLPIEATKEDIIGMFAEGRLQGEVAKLCGISVTTLRRHMKEMGIKGRTRKEARAISEKFHYEDSRKRKEAFKEALDWVDSLTEMPTKKEIKKHVVPWLISEWLIGSMIQTRPERHLSQL